MSNLLKFAAVAAMITAGVGVAQAQQGRSIEVIPAQSQAGQGPAQTFAQAPGAEAPAAQAAEPAAPEPQVAPIPQAPRAERLPVRPIPAPKHVEKCHDERPVYGQAYAPRYQERTAYAPRYQEPRYERYSYAPRYDYGYRRGY
jgi:hypothetical protein